MNTRTRALLVASALLCACEAAPPPAPSILSVEPALVASGREVEVRLRIDALMPGTMDYGTRSVSSGSIDSLVRVWVGGLQVPVRGYEEGDTLLVAVPASMATGEYDVKIALSDGREATQARALTIATTDQLVSPEEPSTPKEKPSPDEGDEENEEDEGDGENGNSSSKERLPSGYHFDALSPQVRDAPFTLNLHAEGSGAQAFRGLVWLRSSKGGIWPQIAGPFLNGDASVVVRLSKPGPQTITVEDAFGKRGVSNSFMVRPH
ncbi:hypothetical protein P2318_16815 [Myxococcaceae bacterium GXIMD 01537]